MPPALAPWRRRKDKRLLVRKNKQGETFFGVMEGDIVFPLIFPVPRLVAFISRIMTLLPGDVVLTGTPAGVGPVQPGDVVEVVISGVGRLVNRVEANKDRNIQERFL